MFEYHGWVTVCEDSSEPEDNSALLDENCREIKAAIEEYKDNMCRVEMFFQNGSPYVRFDGSRNHSKTWVLNLFTRIGSIAKGSYGLLYVRDDESEKYDNEFQVWRMARGHVTRMKELLLSPCDPLLETY